MFGLFKRKDSGGSEKLPGPKRIPDLIGQSLVVNFKEDPNWVWTLLAVMKPKEEKDQFDIRVFSDSMANTAKVSVKDFKTLDAYPGLILFEGSYDKKNKKARLQVKYRKTE